MNSIDMTQPSLDERMHQTRAVLLTAATSSAIATIAVRGPDAWSMVDQHVRSVGGKRLALTIDRPRFAFWHWADDQMPPEHVVVVPLREDLVELHCHGGVAINRLMLSTLNASRTPAARLDTTHEHFAIDPDEDVYQTAARMALTQAPTLKVAAILIDQWQGALSSAMQQIESHLSSGNHDAAERIRIELRERAKFGMKLLDPWRLTLAGPPNVGKSSLTNALCGAKRVLVHEQPGTTRDAIETTIVVDSWPLRLTDTAGVREATESIEQMGIAATHARWQSADIGLLVIDCQRGWTETHDRLLAQRPSGPVLVVVNKIDQVDRGDQALQKIDLQEIESMARSRMHDGQLVAVVATSATQAEGVQSLLAAIGQYLDQLAPPPGVAVPFLQEQIPT